MSNPLSKAEHTRLARTHALRALDWLESDGPCDAATVNLQTAQVHALLADLGPVVLEWRRDGLEPSVTAEVTMPDGTVVRTFRETVYSTSWAWFTVGAAYSGATGFASQADVEADVERVAQEMA